MNKIDVALLSVLPAQSLYAVGGSIRDEALGLSSRDADYVVVGIELHEIASHLACLGRVDFVGASFGTLKLYLEGEVIDIALPRREMSTGSGHRDFVVTSGPDVTLVEDLGRRDFTFNAIARHVATGMIIDPQGGRRDLKNGVLRSCSAQSFLEDPLRMLRAIQFYARLGLTAVYPETYEQMRKYANLCSTIPRERIFSELEKLMGASNPYHALQLMQETGIMGFVFPELMEGHDMPQNKYHKFSVLEHNLRTCAATPAGDMVLRLSGLLHDVGKPRTKNGDHFYDHECVGGEMVRPMLERTGAPGQIIAQVERLVKNHMYTINNLSDAGVRRFARRVGLDLIAAQFALRRADVIGSGYPDLSAELAFEARVASVMEAQPPVHTDQLAINGSDIIAHMIDSGIVPINFRGDRRVGETLKRLLEIVTEDPNCNTRVDLLALL